METQHSLSRLALRFCLILGLIFTLPQLALCAWTQLANESGGVIPDVQTLRSGDDDVVWAASMGTGLFRNVWDGDWDNDWTEYLPGKGFLGVDAIYHTPSGQVAAEYVLGASTKGVWYKKAPLTTYGWDRPNGNDYPHNYDTWWTEARIQDAAFYHDGTSFSNDPQDKYFVILAAGGVPPSGTNLGIYKWNDGTSTFGRVDNLSGNPEFDHFYRYLGDPNIIFVTGPTLYKISGSDYTNLTFGSESFGGATVLKAYGMSQWKVGNDVHSYVLLKIDATPDEHRVYYRKNQESWSYIWTAPANMLDDPQAYVVGKPHGASDHYLWITAGEYGVWFYNTDGSYQIQINGSDSPNSSPELKRWEPRFMIPDTSSHLGTNEEMRLFLGTHHYGVWYLTSTLINTTWTHTWSKLNKKFAAVQNRDLRLLDATPELLGPSYMDGGLWKTTSGTWGSVGIPNNPTAQKDPACNKGMQTAINWTADGNNYDYYFGCWPYVIHMDAFGSPVNVEMQGLYGVHSTSTVSVDRIDFDPDHSGDDLYTIARFADAEGLSGNDDVLYVSTGMSGPTSGNPHVICQKRYSSGWIWDRIGEFAAGTDYTGLCPLAMAPDPYDEDGSLYVVMGNYFGLSYPNYYPKVLQLSGPAALWTVSTLWSGTDHYQNSSVHDLTVIKDPNPLVTDKVLMFWGVSKFKEQNSPVSYMQKGAFFKYSWYSNDYHADPVYGINDGAMTLDGVNWENPPAVKALECFNHPSRGPIVVAVLAGVVDHVPVSHVYIYMLNPGATPTWRKWHTPADILDDDVYPGGQEIHVNAATGYDIYVTTDGGPLIYDNNAQDSRITTGGWEWISFNCTDVEDSLKYLFANMDSLEVIRDQYGNRFKPYDNPPLDQIHVWNWLKGYSVKSWVTDTMAVFGPQIPWDSAMVLYKAPQDSSWIFNYIAYLPTDTLNVNACFLADSDTVIIVKQDDGNFWRPGDGDDFYMRPGKGYQVGVNHDMTFSYPAQQGQSIELPPGQGLARGIADAEPQHFVFAEKTGDFYCIYVEDLLVNGQPPQAGDEVGVFAPNNLCVGAGVYEGSFPIEIAGWKDDPCTEALDGYTSGDTLSFKFYDASAGLEAPLEMMAVGQSYPSSNSHAFTRFEQGYYAEHHLQASFTLPGSYALMQNYPNPFNPSTTIRYDLPFESIVKLEIFDLMGRNVITLVDGWQSAGFRSIHWDGKNNFGAELASGVYFYRLKADATQAYMGKIANYEKTQKMVMIK